MTCQSILSSQSIPKLAPSNILKQAETNSYVHSNRINSLLSHELELSSNLISATGAVNSSSNIRSNQQQVNPVKRPVNAFILWSQQERRKLTDSGLLLSDAESNSIGSVSKRLGLKWRLMSKEEKQPYVLEAERLKQLHRIQHPDYKFSRSANSRNKRFKHSTESSLVTSSASSVNAGDDLYMSLSASSSMYMQQPSPYSVHSSSDYHLNSVESESTVDVDDLDISNFEFDSTGFESLMNAFDFNHPTSTTMKTENNYADGHFDSFNHVSGFADLDRLRLPIKAECDNNNGGTVDQQTTTTSSIEHAGLVLHPQMSIDFELLNQSNFNTTIKQNMLDNSSLVITPPIDNDIVI